MQFISTNNKNLSYLFHGTNFIKINIDNYFFSVAINVLILSKLFINFKSLKLLNSYFSTFLLLNIVSQEYLFSKLSFEILINISPCSFVILFKFIKYNLSTFIAIRPKLSIENTKKIELIGILFKSWPLILIKEIFG